jgi:hypothetical protein
MAEKLALTASVWYHKGKHIATITHVVLWLSGEAIARGILAGRYDQDGALKEFRKRPDKFKRFDTKTDLAFLAKAA